MGSAPAPSMLTRCAWLRPAAFALLPLRLLLLGVLIVSALPLLVVLALLHDILIRRCINNTYIYNISWEDPAIDQKALDLKADDHVITIASAGDNVLDYLIEGAEVTAVDINLCQIALAELKKVAIQHLSFGEFFAIFAQSNMDLLRQRYPKLRKDLSESSAEFWDASLPSLTSFMYSGLSGRLAWMLSRVVMPLCGLGWISDCARKAMPTTKFLQIAEAHKMQLRVAALICDTVLFRSCCMFAGVPERQVDLAAHRPNTFALVLQAVLYKTEFCTDNYFYCGYLTGEWTETNCPRYLMEKHYAPLREAINQGKLHLLHGSLSDACRAAHGRPFTVASLLDHMDWMPIPDVGAGVSLIVSKMDPARGRLFWRSMADEVHSPPLMWLSPQRVDDSGDRVGMYFSTWIARLSEAPVVPLPREDSLTAEAAGVLARLWTGAKIVSFPLLKSVLSSAADDLSKQARAMEAFYAHQKEDYDSFRENMLHARPWLMHSFPIKKAGRMVWVDIGCGTARNLEFLPVDIIKEYFSRIVILDVSPSLLRMARRRVIAMGLDEIVEIVEEDFTSEAAFKSLPAKGTVDMVTMSYSLSMIPDKAAAIRNAAELLKPGGEGSIGVADFFSLPTCMVRKANPSAGLARALRRAESFFHREWFKCDHVYLLDEDVTALFDVHARKVWDQRERGEVPFLPWLRPYHGIILARSR